MKATTDTATIKSVIDYGGTTNNCGQDFKCQSSSKEFFVIRSNKGREMLKIEKNNQFR